MVSVTPSQGSCTGTSAISCNVGTIASGATATVTIRVTPTVTGKLDNYIDANSEAVLDPNILNNRSSASTAIIDPAQIFTISGTIVDVNGIGVSGISVGVDGSQQGGVTTDISGNYSISVASGGIYTLMPSKYGFAFDPPIRSVPYVASNQTVNFTAIDASASVEGRVLDRSGRGIRGSVVRITDAGGTVVGTSYTNTLGYYNFGIVRIDQNYTVTVTAGRYEFTPRTLFVFEDVTGFNFVALP